AVAPLWPAVLLIALWWVASLATSAAPLRPYRWFVPMHTFGTVYEADLWTRLPEGPERRLIADARARGVDPYQAARALEAAAGPDSPLRVARTAIRADPLAYARVRGGLVKEVFRQGSWMRPELIQLAHPNARAIGAVTAWRERYRKVV